MYGGVTGGGVRDATQRVRQVGESAYGLTPSVVWSAPGRVNLIGEHTDYNDGFVLPFAITQRTAVGATLASDSTWTVVSEAMPDPVSFVQADLRPGAVPGWAGYVAGVVAVLREVGVDVPGARITVASDVPVGAGLSSSAALECATLAALVQLAEADLPRAEWPALAQRAENAYVGVPCGILDQSASTLCESGHALFLDCRDLSTEQVPFDLADAGLSLLVIDTNAPHRNSDGEYAARRAACEAAASELGVRTLRDVIDPDDAMAHLGDVMLRRRARHVLTENERVLRTVDLLRNGKFADTGHLLTESHASMRDDFEITVAETDAAVEAALEAGALGARMTGGGFGGCVIALTTAAAVSGVEVAVRETFKIRGYAPPTAFLAPASAGVAAAV
jgi:galactokinase